MIIRNAAITGMGLLFAALLASPALAQALPPLSVCQTAPLAAACGAVPGDRADGWKLQSRSEVMAQHGMVTTSQPLAAQAGLRVLMEGGNAIDAAVSIELGAMGHDVRAINGGQVGGYQAILVTPGPDPSKPGIGRYYRAGSDHRKDGQAVGW